MRKRIPIIEAERISEKYNLPVVIMFAIRDGGAEFSLVTYGKNKTLCQYAASLGDQIAKKVLNGEIAPTFGETIEMPDEPTIWEKKNAEGK